MKQKTTSMLLSVLLTLTMVLGLLPGMALTAFADSSVRYVDAEGNDMGTVTCKTVAETMETGWYVSDYGTIQNRIGVKGDVNLILKDNCTFRARGGIYVPAGSSLTIWAQSTGEDKGSLVAVGKGSYLGSDYSGIGGNSAYFGGDITINGGDVYADGNQYTEETRSGVSGGSGINGNTVTINAGVVTAIGKGRNRHGGAGIAGSTIVINGGVVNATGGYQGGAGIGGFGTSYEEYSGNITINGGDVTAKGGDMSSAGIGSGYRNKFSGKITITGGTVRATGSESGAGIGGGWSEMTGTVTISGGTVIATGGTYKQYSGAGIGSGDEYPFTGTVVISGGSVTATGGKYSAGIGSARGGNAKSGHVHISGGEVFAKGGEMAAGIGGGSEIHPGDGGILNLWTGGEGCDDVVITGGTVFAQSGEGYCSAIGRGDDDGHMGNITIGDLLRVYTDFRTTGGVDGPYDNRDGNPYRANERDGACMYNHTVLIQKCDHPMDVGVNDGYADAADDYHQRAACVYCGHAMQRETHTLDEENKCDVCGYQGAISVVTFDANGGSGEMDARKVIPGNTLILPACGFTSPSGKAFAGWEIEGMTYAAGEAVTINADTTVKALWSRAYRLWVGDTQVTEDNAGDIFGDGTAIYERLNNTLTLNNAWIVGSSVYDRDNTITAGIISELAGLQIIVEGESIVNTADAAYGVYSVGALSVSGTGRLSARGNVGVGTGGNLDISVSKLIASGEQYGIDATGSITINGSEVTAEGGERGVKATKNIGVSGKQSIVVASSTGDGYAIEAGEDIGFDADLAVVSPINGTVGSTDNGVTVLDKNANAASAVVIAKPVNYRVTVTPVSLTLTYGEEENRTLTAAVTTNDENDLGALSYCWERQEAKDDWETVAEGADATEYTVPTDEVPGEYVYRCLVANTLDGRTEQAVSNEVAVTVEKAEPVITAPEPIDLTYTGDAQALIAAGSAEGGALVYAVTDGNAKPTDEEYTEEIPSKTETGTYYVWYKVIGDEYHKDTAPVSLTVRIAADMTALNAKIGEATDYYDSIKADYPEIAETLLAAINTAKAVTDESQSEVDAAVTALDDALNTAKTAKQKADETSPEEPDHPDDSTPDTPAPGGSACKWCGKTHTGFWGGFVHFFHNIAYFFAHLFGRR